MGKTLLYRLFGVGKVPENARLQIQKEGVVLQDEGIGGSVTFKQFRAPGKYYGWKRSWFSGSVVLTKQHLLAFKYSQPVIGVSWRDSKFSELDVSLEDENRLCVRFDASTFRDDASGKVEVRLSTSLAQEMMAYIEHLGRNSRSREQG